MITRKRASKSISAIVRKTGAVSVENDENEPPSSVSTSHINKLKHLQLRLPKMLFSAGLESEADDDSDSLTAKPTTSNDVDISNDRRTISNGYSLRNRSALKQPLSVEKTHSSDSESAEESPELCKAVAGMQISKNVHFDQNLEESEFSNDDDEESDENILCVDTSDDDFNKIKPDNLHLSEDVSSVDSKFIESIKQRPTLEEMAEKFFAKKKLSRPRNKIGNGENKEDEEVGQLNDDDNSDEDEDDESAFYVPLELIRDELRSGKENIRVDIHEFRNQYDEWLFYMCENYNVILHGYGSKICVLDDFRTTRLHDKFRYFVMKAYDSNFRLKDALICLSENLNFEANNKKSFRSMNSLELAQNLSQNCEMIKEIVILIYNIDGPNIRDDSSQTALSLLADCPNLHILATVDHLNSSIMWDREKIANFRWIFVETNTFKNYDKEIFGGEDSNTLGLSKRGKSFVHSVASLESIWSSLTEKARKIFQILVAKNRKQSSSTNPKQRSTTTNSTMTFYDLYRRAHDDFIVSSESALRQLLTEFEDHRLIARKNNADGCEVVETTIDGDVLKEFLKNLHISQ